jgi:hypothetical protein
MVKYFIHIQNTEKKMQSMKWKDLNKEEGDTIESLARAKINISKAISLLNQQGKNESEDLKSAVFIVDKMLTQLLFDYDSGSDAEELT